MDDDHDKDLLRVIAHIGPISPHALAFHPVLDEFESFNELDDQLPALAEEDHLHERTFVDVMDDPVYE